VVMAIGGSGNWQKLEEERFMRREKERAVCLREIFWWNEENRREWKSGTERREKNC